MSLLLKILIGCEVFFEKWVGRDLRDFILVATLKFSQVIVVFASLFPWSIQHARKIDDQISTRTNMFCQFFGEKDN